MESIGSAYPELNNQWKSTCKLLFGKEVGELSDYRNWLMELNNQRFIQKSAKSGNDIVFTSSEFCNNAKFIGMDEVDFNKKFEPLSINEIKDIDSIVSSLNERFYYCGNIVLGNSKFIEKSSNVSNSFFIIDSVKIDSCKNIAYSQYLRLCENVFGTNEGGEGKFCIRCSILFKNTRCFELWNSPVCSDSYYSYGLENCREAFFSFNAVGKSHIIGNLTLPKDKYLSIKSKLLSEISDQLIRDKKLPSLMDLVSGAELNHTNAIAALDGTTNHEPPKDKKIINDSFSKTSALIFGKPLPGNIDDYSEWLSAHVVVPHTIPSVLSGLPVPMSKWPGLSQIPPNRVVTYGEALKLAEQLRISEPEAENISLNSILQYLGKIAYFTPEHMVGTNTNLIECQWGSTAANCYRSVICVYSKNCAYSSWPRSSEYLFGCGIVFESGFSMKCYDSVKLTRCFEVDGGSDCADTYFSHNVEGLSQCAFCFNTKSKRYAVGNAEIGQDKFLEFKKMLQEWTMSELEKKKKVGLSVYDLGCFQKS
ncbi:TPA: hypothetical protein HA238_02470 [Candidatus Micrarchaeota archaeon]|nr:hypothetical protein [Candidatus Micrarchaeota archaeon]